MKKILIVEDDQIVANIYRNKFSVEGFQVETAGDGEAGLELMRKFRPDAVVLDLMLPKINGVELMKRVRAEPDFASLPIFVFSNTYLTNMVQEAWKAGATKCLSKSACSPKQLLDVVRSAFSEAGSSRDAESHVPPPVSAPPVRSPPSMPATPPHAHAVSPDAEVQARLRKSVLADFPVTLSALRTLHKNLIKADSDAARLKEFHEMFQRVHTLSTNAGIAGLRLIAQMADAFEALVRELQDKPRNLNPSTLRTIASVIDFLGVLFEKANTPAVLHLPPPRILVVDDEAISRRAVSHALERAKLKSTCVEDPQQAYKLLNEQVFDLIFVDVDMPGMNGYELCAKLRKLPVYEKTPVVFVTGLNDFESRANSTMSGGNDFVVKPFLFMELAVKALIYVLRRQIKPTHQRL